MKLTFSCGCQHAVSERANGAACPAHQAARVTRVDAPAPRFSGLCRGPHAEYRQLDPKAVDLAPGGRLRLKRDKE